MNPMYFGDSQSPLFGVYHPPRRTTTPKEGVLLCPPLGTELLRSHRALRQLASMLSKNGHPVLRFDYFATGDSSGQCEEGRLCRWQQDVATAIQELVETADLDTISIVGLRLGATLAAGVQLPANIELKSLVLWDPVVEGEAYVGERIAADLEYETHTNHQATVEAQLSKDQTVGIMGFALTRDLRLDFGGITLENFGSPQAADIFLLTSDESPATLGLKSKLEASNSRFSYEHVEIPGEWGEFDAIGSLLLPQEMIQGIVACLN